MQDLHVFASLEYRPVRVAGDWLPDDFAVDAYWNGVGWNGFVVPLFTLASAQQLCKSMPTLEFVASDSSFLLSEGHDAVSIQGKPYRVGGAELMLYAIGDSWCWRHAESI
ncbi:hypothetical protein [Cupriavidus oxalaticus]|uniref:Uncharacterized protein n=1 Tax=Cupriavidus oxalaticus TaxID=96344 RepID=A0A4P7LJQ4_9BURK|nr:hypothetical protein [Cupriavidus oxalaticus]QBY56390.1 hypothetical protein E0W60_35895 [Cupriavidus oxalaticus]